MKQEKIKYNFKALGQAIKEAQKAKGLSRNELADQLNIAPRYIASIENSGQHPSLQVFYELVTILDVSVDQFFFPNKESEKSTQRRQLESLLDEMDSKDLMIMIATANGIQASKLKLQMQLIFITKPLSYQKQSHYNIKLIPRAANCILKI